MYFPEITAFSPQLYDMLFSNLSSVFMPDFSWKGFSEIHMTQSTTLTHTHTHTQLQLLCFFSKPWRHSRAVSVLLSEALFSSRAGLELSAVGECAALQLSMLTPSKAISAAVLWDRLSCVAQCASSQCSALSWSFSVFFRSPIFNVISVSPFPERYLNTSHGSISYAQSFYSVTSAILLCAGHSTVT